MSRIVAAKVYKRYDPPPVPGRSRRRPEAAVEVLRGLDLEVAEGEFLAVMGNSGAGKSTLLHLLGALDTPTSGSIRYDERELAELSPEERARFRNEHIGFVFQFHHLLPEFTALENVLMPARIARRPLRRWRDRAAALLDDLGLGGRLHHRPAELSGGEQQRVALARALLLEPRVLLADEPTGNLDDHTSTEIHDLLCRINEERPVTLIIATHSLALARRAHRLVRLSDGRILKEEGLDDVRGCPQINTRREIREGRREG